MKKKKNKYFYDGFILENRKHLFFVVFIVLTAAVYFHNLTRDIYSGDIGDLVTAACVWGVAHPPGYPLFTFLGGVLCHLPLALAPVSKVGLLSVFSSLGALFLYYLFSYKVTKSIFISLLSTSILSFSYLFWLHTEIPEVLALNSFFAVSILYFSFMFYIERKDRYLYLLCFFAGLCLTHHHTILFILPAAFILTIFNIKYIFSSKKRVIYSILLFIAGLLPYLYVPIAASKNPVINWDNASNFGNFMHLILRKDYGGFAPTDKDVVTRVPLEIRLILVNDYFRTLISTFSYQIIIVSILGIFQLFRTSKLILISLFFVFIFSGVAFIFYGANPYTSVTSIGILERFYSLSFVVFTFSLPYGFLFLKNLIDSRVTSRIYSYILLSYFLIIPFFMIQSNFLRTDLSSSKIGNRLAFDILSSVPFGSVLFVSGDTTTFNIWYAHYVLGKRSDIGIINPPGVGSNIYLDSEINDFHRKNPNVKLTDVMHKTIEDIQGKRRIFLTKELDTIDSSKFVFLPRGMVMEIVRKDEVPSLEKYIEQVEKNLSSYSKVRRETLQIYDKNLITSEVPLIYSNALYRVGNFIDSYYKKPEIAEHYYRRGLWIDSDNSAAYAGLGIVQYKAYADCAESINNLKIAIEKYRVWKKYYIQTYYIYKQCKADKKILSDFKKNYQEIFNEDIDKIIKD